MPLTRERTSHTRITAKQKIYEAIKDLIISRQLQPGEKVSDMEIATSFKVSRTPVREALQLLETQKLVKSYPGKTTIVTEIEHDNIEKWYLPMITLQQLAISQAIENITTEHVTQMRRLNRQFKKAIQEQEKPMPILKADRDFHSYILDIAGNEYVKDFCSILWIHIQRLEYNFFRDTPLDDSENEHERIISALELKDGYSASLTMKSHWERTMLQLGNLKPSQDQ